MPQPAWLVAAVTVLGLAACGGNDESSASGADATMTQSSAPRRFITPRDSVLRPLATTDDSANSLRIDTSQREAVLLFLRTVHDASSGVPVDWTGSFDGCKAGDSSEANKQAIERRINWVRAMAGVPAAVRLDSSFNQKAQQTALLMAAQGQLSHTPPSNWLCWTPTAADGAGNSNLTQSAGASAITDDYLHDFGANNAAAGHRRWLLYPQTRSMGTGDVQGSQGGRTVAANALWVFDSQGGAPRPAVRDGFVAWPPPGHVPHTTVYPRWSLSYPDADFSQARVAMTENGQAISTQLEAVADGYGENTLVWFAGSIRDGVRWPRPAADTRYEVTVSNVRVAGQLRSFNYSVTVFDADTPAPWGQAGSVRGAVRQTTGTAARYEFNAVSGASAYQWISRPLSALVWSEGAESGATGVQLSTSAGYEAVASGSAASGTAASGSRAFHLAHAQPVDQTVTLKPVVVPKAASRLRFASRLALASTTQTALVEVSADEGRSWVTAYRQDGSGDQGERSFVSREVALGAWVGQTVQLRLRYAKPSGSYYPQSSDGIGWYIDDLVLLDADTLAASTATPSETSSPTQTLALPGEGRWLVQARPGMYGQWPAWSSGLVVEAAGINGRVDCLLSWAEGRFPELLTPSAQSAFLNPYRYRAYKGDFYVGYSTADGRIYTLSNGVMSDLGAADTWLGQAGC